MEIHKLGCLPPKDDQRTLRFAKYLVASQLPPPPASCDWSAAAKQPWGMMANDRLGCCVVASKGHAIQTWTANNGAEVTLPDQVIVDDYMRESGGVDSGLVELDSLNDWRTVGIAGHRLGAYAAVMTTSQTEVMESIWLCGTVLLGVNLPSAVQGAHVWDVPRHQFGLRFPQWQPGSWGGHAVIANAFGKDQTGKFWIQAISWAAKLLISWQFFTTFVNECYALLSPEWVNGDTIKLAPSGFDLATLQQDLSQLGQAA